MKKYFSDSKAFVSECVLQNGKQIKMLRLFEDHNNGKYAIMTFGLKKAKVILDNIETIKKFVNEYDDGGMQ